MSNQEQYIDIEDLAREGKAPPQEGHYRIKIDQDKHVIDDPVVTGRQLLDLAGKVPAEEHLVYLIKNNGLLEDVSLEETVDLRIPGLERFITFLSDRSFRFELDGKRQDWGTAEITGATLKKLAGVGKDHDVWLEAQNSEDQKIESRQMISLDAEGVERFYTKPKPPQKYLVVINAEPFTLDNPVITFEEVVQMAFPGNQSSGNVAFSMTYRHAASKPHSGELGPGGKVELKHKGTVFNVSRTIKS